MPPPATAVRLRCFSASPRTDWLTANGQRPCPTRLMAPMKLSRPPESSTTLSWFGRIGLLWFLWVFRARHERDAPAIGCEKLQKLLECEPLGVPKDMVVHGNDEVEVAGPAVRALISMTGEVGCHHSEGNREKI